MKTYHLKFTMRSATGSLWQADTLFGHLCWLLLWRAGDAKLQEWLDRYEAKDPPLILSDGFPGDLLPRPMPIFQTASAVSKEEGLRQAEQRKPLKKIAWLTLAEFAQIQQGQAFQPSDTGNSQRQELAKYDPQVNFKNQINRNTNTTGNEGQLYPFEEHRWKEVSVYIRVADDAIDCVKQLFEDLQTSGYGKRKSVGYGQIESIKGWDNPFEGFGEVKNANALMSLSHFVPAPHDPLNGQWKTHVKYGKLGGEWATVETPFKKPLVRFTPGSWFYTSDPNKAWFGRMVKDISWHDPDNIKIVQYGMAFAVPMKVDTTLF